MVTAHSHTLRDCEGLVRDLLADAADEIMLVDDRLRVLFVSHPSRLAPASSAGADALAVVHPEDVEAFQALADTASRQPGARAIGRCRVRDGDAIWRLCDVVMTNRLHDAARGIVITLKDAASRTQLDAMLKAAHDLNNVLMVISGFATLCAESIGADSPAAQDLQQIIEAAQRGERLTSELLALRSSHAHTSSR